MDNTFKGLAKIILSGEPVYVTSIQEGTGLLGNSEMGLVATVTRAKATQDGLIYITDQFPVEQLETREEQAVRELTFEKYARNLYREAEAEEFNSFSGPQMDALAKAAAEAQMDA